MPYTFEPKQKHAKVHGSSLRVSAKASNTICRTIKKKTLARSKRLLMNLISKKQSLDGKYYTKAAKEMLNLLNSCEKNAEFLGLDADRLMVHATATHGAAFHRRRRKGAFGSKLKSAYIEIMLIERGKERKDKVPKKKIQEAMKKPVAEEEKTEQEMKKEIEGLREKNEDLEKKVEDIEKKAEA